MNNKMIAIEDYARVTGLTEEQVVALIREGQLSGRKIDGKWQIIAALPAGPARHGKVIFYGSIAALMLAMGALLFALNPDQDAHVEKLRQAFTESAHTQAPNDTPWQAAGRKLAATINLLPLLAELEYRDYGLVSVTKAEKGVMTIGMFGAVFVVGEP